MNEYTLFLPVRPDLAVLQNALHALDPRASADWSDGNSQVRIATTLDRSSLMQVLTTSGTMNHAAELVRRPSTCCGGCSG